MIFIADNSEYSPIGPYWFSQSFKNQNDFLDCVFKNLINTLNYCPEITKVILISPSVFSISKKDLKSFIDYNYNLPLTVGLFKMWLKKTPYTLPGSLVKNAIIFTERDLIIDEIDNPREDHNWSILDNSKLIDLIKGDTVIINSIFLSKKFINIIKSIPHLEIYKRAFENPDTEKFLMEKLDKVNDTPKYMEFIFNLDEYDELTRKYKYFDVKNWNIPTLIDCFTCPWEVPISIKNSLLK